jgi:ATP-dependent protease HslVU (ClpYQ) peptidase subunit
MQVANMAKLAGVAPKKVLKDIADNAEAASTFFKGDITLLSQQAVQARRLGTNLKEVTATAEKLLDFENNIEQELVAATYVGGQFNLNRARALAMEGKLVEAQEETLKQIQRSGDFRQQDYFTQQQLAKAANMSVEEINKQLNAQEKLGKLNEEDKKRAQEAIDAGLDITNLNDEQLMQEVEKAAAQKEMASTITDMENTFKGILASVGGALLPIFQLLGPVLAFAFFPLKLAAKALQFIIDGIMWLLKKIPFVGDMVDKIGSLTGQVDSAVTNFSVAGLEGGGMGSVVEAGDVISPANGQTMISTKEGGLLKLSGNDDVVAAPGAASAIGGGSSLAALSAPLNAMINEIKALRADLAAGKIAVNMDGARVSAGIGKIVDGSSRNNFSMG